MATKFTTAQVIRRAIYLMEQMVPLGTEVTIESDDDGNLLVVGESQRIMRSEEWDAKESFLERNEGRVRFWNGYTAECSESRRPHFIILPQGEPD